MVLAGNNEKVLKELKISKLPSQEKVKEAFVEIVERNLNVFIVSSNDFFIQHQ